MKNPSSSRCVERPLLAPNVPKRATDCKHFGTFARPVTRPDRPKRRPLRSASTLKPLQGNGLRGVALDWWASDERCQSACHQRHVWSVKWHVLGVAVAPFGVRSGPVATGRGCR